MIQGFCIRGLLSILFSRAMENLTGEINSKYPKSMTVSDHGWWFSYFSNVGWLTEQSRSIKLNHRKLVLIGHSFGATAAIMTAQRLNMQNIEVDLLCPIDPAAQYPDALVIPSNVRRVVAFYQNTPGQLGEGVIRKGTGWTDTEWKARASDDHRIDTHLGIANDPFVHGRIIKALEELNADKSANQK